MRTKNVKSHRSKPRRETQVRSGFRVNPKAVLLPGLSMAWKRSGVRFPSAPLAVLCTLFSLAEAVFWYATESELRGFTRTLTLGWHLLIACGSARVKVLDAWLVILPWQAAGFPSVGALSDILARMRGQAIA
jgi:hypothetical protein